MLKGAKYQPVFSALEKQTAYQSKCTEKHILAQSTMSCNDSTLLLLGVCSPFPFDPVDPAKKAIEHTLEECQ